MNNQDQVKQPTEKSEKLIQRLKDALQDNEKLQSQMSKDFPKYFSHLKQLNP